MKLIDLTGKRFGRWTVLNKDKRRNDQAAWVCRCSCGTEKTVLSQTLRRGDSKSCGCLRAEQHYLPKGEAAFNAFLDNTKRGAKTEGIPGNFPKRELENYLKIIVITVGVHLLPFITTGETVILSTMELTE